MLLFMNSTDEMPVTYKVQSFMYKHFVYTIKKYIIIVMQWIL